MLINLDVNGKIVLVLSGMPESDDETYFDPIKLKNYLSLSFKRDLAKEHGIKANQKSEHIIEDILETQLHKGKENDLDSSNTHFQDALSGEENVHDSSLMSKVLTFVASSRTE